MRVLVFLISFFPTICLSYINLEISITHRRGIDKGLTLVSELHSIEPMMEDKEFRLNMKDGYRFSFNSKFLEKYEGIGPTHLVQLFIEIRDNDGRHVHTYTGTDMVTALGEKKIIKYEKAGQLVEVNVTPHMFY